MNPEEVARWPVAVGDEVWIHRRGYGHRVPQRGVVTKIGRTLIHVRAMHGLDVKVSREFRTDRDGFNSITTLAQEADGLVTLAALDRIRAHDIEMRRHTGASPWTSAQLVRLADFLDELRPDGTRT